MNIYEYMQSLEIEGVTSGIDALTITATGLSGKLAISLALEGIRDYLDAQPKHNFRYMDARGWAKGSVRYADKYDHVGKREWAILMVTGNQSGEVWDSVRKDNLVKYTRLDVYVDVMLRERVLSLPRMIKDNYKGKREVSLIESLTGDTFYCGKRESSPVYVRIYDKSGHYNKEQGFVWRFEAELKKDEPRRVWDSYGELDVSEWVEGLVWGACKKSDIPTPRQGVYPDIRDRCVTLSCSEMKLNWLRSTVSRTVKELYGLGYGQEAIEAVCSRLPVEAQLRLDLGSEIS